MALIPYSICGDSHGHMADKGAVKAFLKFCDLFKPKLRIHLGDLMDLPAWRKGADQSDKEISMQGDYDDGMEFLEVAEIDVLLRGNHDHRLIKVASEARGPMKDYATGIVMDMEKRAANLGCRILPWGVRDGVYELGKVRSGGFRVVHGYRAGIHATAAEVRAYGRVIHGHIHCVGTHIGSTYDASEGHSIGALCKIDMDYAAGYQTTLRQEHGWGYGVYNDRTGAVVFQHARKVDGKFIYASEFGKI